LIMSDPTPEVSASKTESQIFKELIGPLLEKLSQAQTDIEREQVARAIFDIGVKVTANTVGHDLGNQLSSANGYLEILMGRKNLTDEEKAELLTESYKSVHSTADLIAEIARINEPELWEFGNLPMIKIDRPQLIEDDDGI